MNSPLQPAQADSPWPGPTLLGLIALILRATLGFALLSEGLAGYFVGGRTGMSPLGGLPMLYQQAVPVAQICLGLALIVGFGTVIAAVTAALLGLGLSALTIFQAYIAMTTTGNPGRFFNGMPPYYGGPQAFGSIASMAGVTTAVMALHQVAVIAMGKPAINRFSVDALVFRREEEALPAGPPSRPVEGRPEPISEDDLIA